MAQTTSLITGSQFYSMQNGPVLSDVLSLMKGKTTSPLWSQCIEFVPHIGQDSPSNHCVLKQDMDVTEWLSDFEIELIDKVWHEHGGKEKWTLVNLTHTFPEWDETCASTKSSAPISLETIFEHGLSEPHSTAVERAQEIEYFEAVSA